MTVTPIAFSARIEPFTSPKIRSWTSRSRQLTFLPHQAVVTGAAAAAWAGGGALTADQSASMTAEQFSRPFQSAKMWPEAELPDGNQAPDVRSSPNTSENRPSTTLGCSPGGISMWTMLVQEVPSSPAYV